MEHKAVQLAKIVNGGLWTVVLDRSEAHNKFKVYRQADGHKRLMEKCADYLSAMLYIMHHFQNRD